MSSPGEEPSDDAEAPESSDRGTKQEGETDAVSPSEDQSQTAEDIDLVAALGASIELSPQELRLYIPNKDRHGN
jgi:hypothetical protein